MTLNQKYMQCVNTLRLFFIKKNSLYWTKNKTQRKYTQSSKSTGGGMEEGIGKIRKEHVFVYELDRKKDVIERNNPIPINKIWIKR